MRRIVRPKKFMTRGSKKNSTSMTVKVLLYPFEWSFGVYRRVGIFVLTLLMRIFILLQRILPSSVTKVCL